MASYVIVGRNKDNSEFWVNRKFWYWLGFRCKPEKLDECEIVTRSNMEWDTFYTKSEKSYTKVNVVNNHIKSKANKSKIDNILNLPILS